MTIPSPVMLAGAPGSPYTRKMLAVLRYRRMPYRMMWGQPREMADLPQPKVGLLPTFYLPNEAGELEAVVDSTPLIERFDNAIAERPVRPADAALRFIDDLLEDFGDEWLTKAMFHYRWRYQPDIERSADILPRWRITPQPEEKIAELSKLFAERQISRLYVVGSNDITTPVIEGSYRRTLALMSQHLESHSFLLGNRPSACDFAFYGQLTALTHFDPTPMQIALDEAPRVYAWVDLLDDLSGLEPQESDWVDPANAPDTLKALLGEVGRVYAPFLLANAKALESGADKVEATIDGAKWEQQPFPYQGKCLKVLREKHAALDTASRSKADALLAGTGCEALFS